MEYRELVHQLISISLVHRCRITKSARKAGLYYGQPMILEFITNHDRCTQKELAKGLHISAPSVATSLKRLEKAGMVNRIPDESDTRKKLLAVTENGREALRKFRKICDETDNTMFSGFSNEECEILRQLLQRLYTNLDADSLTREDIDKLLKEEHKK